MTIPDCPLCAPKQCCGVHDVNEELRVLAERQREERRRQVDEETACLLLPYPPPGFREGGAA